MSDHMNPTEEETYIGRIEADASNPDLWEEVGGPDTRPRTLGTSITIRLDPDLAERLRAIARRLGVGYTSLARQMLEERISQREGGAAPSARFVLDVQVSPSGDVTVEQRAS
ncbi:MAG: ribbon-helix-helix protein, CopG family [Egibacteraceae bacterium]